ncbi:MAG: hypothetical protein ACOC53_02925 [Candidatus Saliniplasma sp.]
MTTIFDARKVPVILIILFIVSSGIVLVFQNSQADETTEFPYPEDDRSWDVIGAQHRHQLNKKGEDVLIAVLDTGIVYRYHNLKEIYERIRLELTPTAEVMDITPASGSEDASITAEYPPLPPADSDSPIPYYEGNTVLFILGVIVILAVGWTAFIYYRYFKERKKSRKKMTRNEKKRY